MQLKVNLGLCLDQFHPVHSLLSTTLVDNALLLVLRPPARVSYDALCLFPQNNIEFLSQRVRITIFNLHEHDVLTGPSKRCP